jgi:hypothetical protein
MAMREITYLGHVISQEGIRPDPAKVETLLNCPVPSSLNDVGTTYVI